MFRFRMLLVSMLLFVFCCPLVSHAEIDEASMMENAKSNYQEGGYYFATTWLERILKNWPDTPQREEVLLMMSKAYAATGREEKALTTVRTLLKEFPRASDKLDPGVVSLIKEIEARKTSPYSSFEPVGLPAASTPAAKAAVEPALAPAAVSAAEVANTAAAIPSSPAPTTHAEPPAAAPVAAPVAAPAPVETPAPVIAAAPAETRGSVENQAPVAVAAPPVSQVINPPAEPAAEKAPVEAQAAVTAQVTTPPEAVDAKCPPATAAPAMAAAAEPTKAAPAPAEPAAEKVPVEVNAPVAVELPESPVAAVVTPAPAKVEKVAEASPEDSKAGSAVTYTLELGEYVGQNTLAGAKRLVRKAGLTPVVTPGPMREEKMLRIQVGQFAEREAAKKLQDKIRAIGAEQFMLVNKEGAYRVFTGSYFDRAAAVAEQKRLAGRGIKSQLKQVTVSVPTFVLTAGSFLTEKSANDTLTALERLGLKGEVLAVQ